MDGSCAFTLELAVQGGMPVLHDSLPGLAIAHRWYCRFFQGRRSPDDERQISRWLGVAGPTGRWKASVCQVIYDYVV